MTITFSPIRQTPAILERFLARLSGEVWVYDDNIDPESSALLRDADVRILAPIDLPTDGYKRETTHEWPAGAISRVAAIKNYAIDRFMETSSNHLFLVDSDVILQDHTVGHLQGAGLPIVSLVYWSQWNPGGPWLPNVWDESHYQFRSRESITRLTSPGHYEVGGLGAATLIEREVLERIRFDPVPNFPMWGEDRWFCMRAGVHGIPLHACTHMAPFHIYRDEQIEESDGWNFAKAEGWKSEHLTAEWARSLG